MQVQILTAFDQRYTIGDRRRNTLPWRIPSDLQRFKELTMGKSVLMGRKTWESLPRKVRPLPGRTNLVLSRNCDYSSHGAEVLHDYRDALKRPEPVVIIGGGEIYRLLILHAQTVFCTRVDGVLETKDAVRFPHDMLRRHFTRQPAKTDDEYLLRDKSDAYKTAYERWERI